MSVFLRQKHFFFTTCESKTERQRRDTVRNFSAVFRPRLLVKLDTFLLLDSFQSGSCALSRCFLRTFFFPCGVHSSSSHTSPHTWTCGHLESVKTAGVTAITSPSERMSEPALSQLMETSKPRHATLLHGVSHRRHPTPFWSATIQIEACFPNKWIKWNEFDMAKSMVGWWNVPGFPLRLETDEVWQERTWPLLQGENTFVFICSPKGKLPISIFLP